MQLREALRAGLQTLVEHDVPSAELAAELLLMHAVGCDRTYLYTEPQVELSAAIADRYFGFIAERSAGKPTQYITGHQDFWGLDLEVTPDVLIPRPETERVVECLLELAKSDNSGRAWRIVDVGTGSGCIALALASELPQATVVATDISYAALAVASRNATRLGLGGRVKFLHADLLDPFVSGALQSTFDFVVSNPPYVGRDELDQVQREVREFEPRLAWGGLERADEIYRRLFPQALAVLKPGGHVVVEVGYDRASAIAGLLDAGWTEISGRPDLAGIPRVVTARKAP